MSVTASVGLISGLDFGSIVSQLIAVSARPANQLRFKQGTFVQKRDAFQPINQALLSLQSSLSALQSESDFTTRRLSSSEFDIATATVEDGAPAGTFSVKVLQLARENRLGAQGIATQDETSIAAGDGTFEFALGSGTVTSIDVTGSTTLTQLRDAINADEDSGVRATIVNDGSATNPYRLVLSASEAGSENAINIINNDTTLDFANPTIEAAVSDDGNTFAGTAASGGTFTGTGSKPYILKITQAGDIGGGTPAKYQVSTDGGITFGAETDLTIATVNLGDGVTLTFDDIGGTESFVLGDKFAVDVFDPNIQAGEDSIVEIDGIQVRRSSNEIEDAIEGVTITAKKVDASLPTTISVDSDTFEVKGLINTFVNAYNATIKAIDSVSSFDLETKAKGILFADSTVRSARSTISNIISSAVSGLTTSNSLGSIGIDLDSEGLLLADQTELGEAIDDRFDEVMRLFALAGSSTSSGMSFDSLTEKTAVGTFGVGVTTAAQRATVTGAQAVDAGGIALAEVLTFIQNSKTKSIQIAAGTKLSVVVSKLNTFFSDEGLILRASEDAGKLKIESLDYGSGETFTIGSDQNGAVSTQLGVGTSDITATGVDVVGTIDGKTALGEGQFLTGQTGSNVEGLKIKVTLLSAGNASVTVTRGIADRIVKAIDAITDTTSGFIKTKTDSLKASIDSINEQLDRLSRRLANEEAKLRRQFVGLELQLSSITSQGNFLLSQLSSINSFRR